MKIENIRFLILSSTAAAMLAILNAGPCTIFAQGIALVSDPYALPPTNGAGWYSATGQSVCFYAEYGTNQGLPPDNTFTGILVRAHSMIVDNCRNITNWYDGNDQIIRFDANLTASLTDFGGATLRMPWVVTLGGNMQVRLANRLNQPTGTFPLSVEALTFTLFNSDLDFTDDNGLPDTNAFLNIRTESSTMSLGQIAVTAVGDGQYQLSSRLNVYSEAAMYFPNGWLSYCPDTNAPTRYDLLPLQPASVTLACISNAGPWAELQFSMRRNVCYVLDRSPDLHVWTSLQTNYAGGCGLGGDCDFSESRTNPACFYRVRNIWSPQP